MKKAAQAPHCFVKKFQHLVLLFLLRASLQNLNRTSLGVGRYLTDHLCHSAPNIHTQGAHHGQKYHSVPKRVVYRKFCKKGKTMACGV